MEKIEGLREEIAKELHQMERLSFQGFVNPSGDEALLTKHEWRRLPLSIKGAYRLKADQILALIKKEYPIMYKEEAEFVGWLIRKGWIPPEKARQIRQHLEQPEEIRHPICPLNMYFEGDNIIQSQCDFDTFTRSCSRDCKRNIKEPPEDYIEAVKKVLDKYITSRQYGYITPDDKEKIAKEICQLRKKVKLPLLSDEEIIGDFCLTCDYSLEGCIEHGQQSTCASYKEALRQKKKVAQAQYNLITKSLAKQGIEVE